ncbi:hypothetical protein ACH4XT_37800 [Streptomyces avidinii]|uniref:hypothetical protein n=1 Tax=Streptomyces avidinii TaxID=1895 RepID=UPI0037B90ACB
MAHYENLLNLEMSPHDIHHLWQAAHHEASEESCAHEIEERGRMIPGGNRKDVNGNDLFVANPLIALERQARNSASDSLARIRLADEEASAEEKRARSELAREAANIRHHGHKSGARQ